MINSKQKTTPTQKVLNAPVGKTLLKMAAPMMGGIISVLLFQLADTYFVGLLGKTELAAISFTFPVTTFIMSLTMGFGIGAASLVAKAIGEENQIRAHQITFASFLLTFLVVGIISFIGFSFQKNIFLLMGATSETLPPILDYMNIWFLGIGILIILMMGNSVIRATGDTFLPSLIMIIVALLNVGLDPLLIFGYGPFPKLGIQGAAIATVISWFVALFASLWILLFKEKLLQWHRLKPTLLFRFWKEILLFAIPVSATNVLMPLANALITRFLAEYGEAAVAAHGVGGRLESVSVVGLMALASVLLPFCAQNFGKGQIQRIKEAINFSVKASFVWGLLAALILYFFSEKLARLFTADPQTITYTIFYLTLIPISFAFFGLAMAVQSLLNALQKPILASILNLSRLFVFVVPFAWMGSQTHQVFGIYAGVSLGLILSGALSYGVAVLILKTL